MCGLLFQIKKNGFIRTDVSLILESLSLIKHRGPDGEGVIFMNSRSGETFSLRTSETPLEVKCDGSLKDFPDAKYDICFGHRRLSIFDLSAAGHQPFCDTNGNIIIFNGEVYNFQEIKTELLELGYTFITKTDTEVISFAYAEWGVNALNKFNGMFSFVIWDAKKKNIFIVNDRFGVKPLYYAESQDTLTFVSETKQLLPFKIIKEFNWTKITEFLKYSFIDHDYETMFSDVYRFPNSHYALINKVEKVNPIAYYSLDYSLKIPSTKKEIESFPELLENAVSLRLRADVPWGISASGGLDSSIILYTANRLQIKSNSLHRVKTVSAISPGHKEDESEFIKFIEKDLGIQSFYTNPIEEFNVEDFVNHIWHQDGPVLSTSFYAQWNVARLAGKNGITVVLGGQGADEIFAGYHHHFYRYCRGLLESLNLLKVKSEIQAYSEIKGRKKSEIWKIVFNELKLKYKTATGITRFDNLLQRKKIVESEIVELLYLDFTHSMLPYYLRSDDRTGMAFSIETRHPFLDYRIVEFAFKLPVDYKIKKGWQKNILRESFDYVPANLRYRKDKKGFTTPKELIQRELAKKYNISRELIDFCKSNNVDYNINNINIQSLSIWMNMVQPYFNK